MKMLISLTCVIASIWLVAFGHQLSANTWMHVPVVLSAVTIFSVWVILFFLHFIVYLGSTMKLSKMDVFGIAAFLLVFCSIAISKFMMFLI